MDITTKATTFKIALMTPLPSGTYCMQEITYKGYGNTTATVVVCNLQLTNTSNI
jgi:hypothetical protein